MAGYLRLWRRKQIVPGLRMNLSKSGVSWSLGVRGAHFTVGPRGTRQTLGIPGTGLSYTTYSGHHASRATRTSRPGQGLGTATSQRASAQPVPAHREPVLPTTKIVWGVVIAIVGLVAIATPIGIILVLLGAAIAAVGLVQRGKPVWRVRVLVRQAGRRPQEAAALLQQALGIDPQNAEALAASAELRFQSHDWVGAADLFERYLRLAPDDWLAEGHAANAWLNAGNADAAIPHFLHVREHPNLTDDSRASLTAGLAMAFLSKGDPRQALDLAKAEPLQRHQLGDGLQQCLFLRAIASYQLGQHSHAISDLDRLAGINPAFPNINEVRNEMLTGTFTWSRSARALQLKSMRFVGRLE